MEAAAGALSPVLRKLGELLAGEYNLAKRVKKGVQSLRTELEMMHAVLREVGKVPPDQLQEPVRIWAGKVRDLSCDMEDAVDDFLVRVDEGPCSKPTNMRNSVNKFLKKTTKLFGNGKALHQISSAIKEAQDLATELVGLRKKYELDMFSSTKGATIDPRVLALQKDVGELVGLDRTRDELIKTLICEDGSSKEHLKTISIVGVGGLGKTTLTKAVFEKIKAQFDCAAFVPVGQNPDIRKIFKDLLYGLDKKKFKDIHNTTRDEKILMEEISEFLVDKRYLIVIDDIWEEETWRFINCALWKNKLHSRVITTTRNVSVSEACLSSSDDMIHKMKPLSDEDSRILFHRRVFQSEEKCPEDLRVVSTDILKKCGGVPLAIITIASLLVSNQRIKQKEEWMHVHSSMGRGVTEGGIVKDMKRILSLSYYDLPSHLKACLLYLSIFPEDFEINRDWLIWRWLAEGFIQCDKDETRLFEIGKSYFNELMNRSLIQPAETNYNGTVVTCRIHDMVLDLICSLSSEDNFISILDNAEWNAPNPQRKFRRLSLHNIKAKVQNHQIDSTSLSKVRTFAVFSPVTCDWLPSLSSFQFLRVLDLGNCGSHESSSCIRLKYVGNLIHLRYLGLRNADVDELPTDIGKLQLLQTLDVRGNSIKELPSSVVQLTNLICLCVDKDLMLPKEMGKLKSLEVLNEVGLSSSPHIVKELSHLTEVRTLCVECVNMDEDLIDILIKSLGNLHKLQILRIHSSDRLLDRMCESWVPPPNLRSFDSWYFGSWFLRLPKWVNSSSLPHLSTLEIDVEELQGDDIQIIGMMPALRFLGLRARRVMGRLVVRTDAFPSARGCMFRWFPTPPCLFPPGAMPRVQHLEFQVSARSITSGEVDCSMGHLPSLEHVVVCLEHKNSSDEEMKTAKAWLRRAAEAHPKCPTIQIYDH
ncbi:disease resistance protein RGA5-like [Triticum urartu]|uniref:Disease resistance protein RPP13 n=1 Tax=Triticum urartu TaxID=4572 RepID=A0A8R7V338_TRIUA|nr:disease resistance protein RGA5-like [Triticum urartu]XP_048541380.1 disease resistance protein RGA5-like [Triticum urartu]XP_048541381.1 disease resistance protein RGA5-like [Triticum urartu]XP_048541382.1 disease resistance protein RGA5-like [Triticum urartu]XP_048541383.1 disease resistance protein RGA5-like [Triticum urartu]XP_048541384.1 disease resistance protein RGA5-like [Triticum urartu]